MKIKYKINKNSFHKLYTGGGTFAPEIETALSNPNLDFTGKIIRVVTTHEGSGLGRVVEDVKRICKGANVADSIAIRGFECKNARSKIENWL